VTLSSPRDQTRHEQETLAVAGLVSGGKGVSRVSVALNGVEISRREERAPQRAVAVNLPVTLREGQNTLVVTASEVDGTVSQEVRTVFFEKRVPLAVAFRYPQDMARVSDAATVVAAIVTSSKGVAKVSVNLNGAEVHQQTGRSAEKSLVLTVPVKLRDGVNTIGITASEADGPCAKRYGRLSTTNLRLPSLHRLHPLRRHPLTTAGRWSSGWALTTVEIFPSCAMRCPTLRASTRF
jgi:hypothetical protein